jgi:aryl-alcohol dehydrogenase-like predicted oxidoreductase
MKTVKLGKNGPAVSQFGLGCMAMSDIYGPSDESESIATIHAALDAGITMLDTGEGNRRQAQGRIPRRKIRRHARPGRFLQRI